MSFEDAEAGERLKGDSPPVSTIMTLQKAVDMGEYDPKRLSVFAEWHTLGRHVQFQFIKQGLDNRERQLVLQWAELNNVLDFRLKPHIKEALENIQKQIRKVQRDREGAFLEYSK